MKLDEIKNAMDDSLAKQNELTEKITAGLVDPEFDVENMQKLKDEKDAEKTRYDTLKDLREDVEKKEISDHVLGDKKVEKPVEKIKDTKNEKVVALNDYLHSKGRIKDEATLQVTSTEAEPIIPSEIIYNPESEVNSVSDLAQYVTRTPVTTPSGNYPILQRATDVFPTVEELKENPKLAEPNFKDVKWDVDTYRGAIPLSNEAVDDAQADLTQIVSQNVKEKEVNTTNAAISEKLKSFTAVSSTAETLVDDIKEVLNVKLDPAYTPTIIASSSFYNTLDTLKDKNGQYMFHQDITSASKGTLQGITVIRVNDKLLGEDGESHAFIGDLKRAILFVDRQQVSLSWADNTIYGKYLMAALRFGIEVADDKAGYFLTVGSAAAAKAKLKSKAA